MNLEPALAKLLEAWQDGGLPEAEEAELLRQLDSDADLCRRFAEQVAMLGAVRAAAEQNPRWLALFDLLEHGEDEADAKVLSFEAATMKRIAPAAVSLAWHQLTAVRVLAAAAVLLPTAFFLLNSPGTPAPDRAAAVPVVPAEAPAPVVAAVAVVIGASPDSGRAVGAYLKPGVISQATGWLTLQTLNGVSVTLDAPFRADLLACDRIRLNGGRARVRVPEGAQGFRLDSPAFDVVDLGTEFAARVNADGSGTCRVFEGMADVSLLDSIGEVMRTQRLTANKSVRVDPSRRHLRVIEEADSAYPAMKQPPRPTLALPSSYAKDVMAMGAVAYWRFEEIRDREVADEVPDGARLMVVGTAAIVSESAGNHSGELTRQNQAEYFQIPSRTRPLLQGDFSVGLFAQFGWLQNFALLSATRYDKEVKGHSFILQSYASFRRSDLNRTGLHAVLRDPPAWDGGVEVYGNARLRPHHWHHIAATREGGQLTLFLDGVRVGREVVGSMPLDCGQIFVGRLNGNARQSRREARGLVGHLDELAFFPRALSGEEIRKLASPVK
jgi:hypothetical protein